MNVLFAVSEIAPWVKTGGLGDVGAALPLALHRSGIDVRVLAPFYPALRAAYADAPVIARPAGLGGRFPDGILRQATTPEGVPLLLLDHPAYFDRPGNPYLARDGKDWPDNDMRFGLLSRVAAWLGSTDCTLDWHCDIVHCNDWQTGLAPAYLRHADGAAAKSLITIHNLAFQGLFAPETMTALGLPAQTWSIAGVEFYGRLSFLKAGIQYADAITTVSPNYAREIQTDAFGMGMAGLLRARTENLYGILNGIDTTLWNPAADPAIAASYDLETLDAKVANKQALQRELGLPVREEVPLLAAVSRLTAQKGIDLLLQVAPALLEDAVQIAILGKGDEALEKSIVALAARYPDQIKVVIGFDEGLAHRIEAGADMFLMPSRFEPCGLNQMYSLRYGTLPVVTATGGLADTVIDCNATTLLDGSANGFVIGEASAAALTATVRRAIKTWRDRPLWRRLQTRGMASDLSWAKPAQRYAEIYADIMARL